MELTKEYISSLLPKRPKDANKGTFGKVLVIAGSENYPGAAYLCCASVYRVGAGLVTLVTTPFVKIIVSRKLPEVTFLAFEEISENLHKYDVLLLGSGLGQDDETVDLVKQLIKKNLPKTVIDGDGLNILSKMENWWKNLKADCVLTPHPKEISRLTGLSIKEIQSHREDIAKRFAKVWSQVVVLKGANTVIASSNEIALSPFVNPALATAGTGDVLAGVITGFLAQGLSTFDAASVGVYIHGLAGEILRKEFGDAGLLASDLVVVLPKAIKKLKMS